MRGAALRRPGTFDGRYGTNETRFLFVIRHLGVASDCKQFRLMLVVHRERHANARLLLRGALGSVPASDGLKTSFSQVAAISRGIKVD